jgi:hypothetical protein
MGAPLLIPAIGAAAGALMKPSNPLQGALLGAAAGYTGGTALGLTGATTAAGGTGLAAGGTALGGGLGSAGAAKAVGGTLGSTGLTAGTGTGLGLGTGTTAGLSAAPITTSLTAPTAAANYALTAPAATPSVFAPTFTERLGMAGQSAYENPIMTAQALNATQGLLTPEQSNIPSAPAVPVTARNKLANYDPMAALNPYQQTVISNQPISLLG